MLCADSGPGPAALEALTVNVYAMSSVKPLTHTAFAGIATTIDLTRLAP